MNMVDPTDPEKTDPYANEEPSGDSLYTDGVISEKESPELQVPARKSLPLRSFQVFILAVAILACTVSGVSLLLSIWEAFRPPSTVGRHPEGSPSRPAPNRHQALQAIPFQLDLPALYPDITSPPGSACSEAWDALVSVQCHDLILDRGNDDGVWSSLDVLPEICDSRCHPSLETAHARLAATCAASDTFILRNYHGKIPSAQLLEGPAAAVAALLRRNEHFCRVDIDSDSNQKYCVTELWERFGVTDGMDVSLQGIGAFIKASRENRMAHGENNGWGRAETSCGFCVMDFLSRTLNSWAEGAVIDPRTGSSLSLPEFMRHVNIAGDRCVPSNTWHDIYCQAVARYLEAGSLLPSDLDGSENCHPPHDLDYLMRNGPSETDAIVSEIKAKLELLAARNNFTRPISLEGIVSGAWSSEDITTGACLHGLGKHYLSVPCYINLSEEEFSYILNEPQSESSIRAAYCRQECSDALAPMKSPKCDHPTDEVREDVSKYLTARHRRTQFCKLTTPVSESDNCAKALIEMRKTEWATKRGMFRPIPIAEMDEELRKLQASAPVPGQLNLGARRAQAPLQGEDVHNSRAQWKNELGASICAGCFWNWAAGINNEETSMNMMMASSREEYVNFLKRYHSTCTSLGADWLGGTPYGDDPVIWRVKEPNGDVMRYMESAESKGAQPDRIYSVREADGRFRLEPTMKPGTVTLWHILKLEREWKGTVGMRLTEWRLEEEKHRDEADAKIFGPDPLDRVKYIGPQGGYGKQDSV